VCCVRRTDTEQLMCLELGNLSGARNMVADSFQQCYARDVGSPQLMAGECRPPEYISHLRGETVEKSLVTYVFLYSRIPCTFPQFSLSNNQSYFLL
jgi:hypothetical protein